LLSTAGPGPFAEFSGTLSGPHAQVTIPITISHADFNLASGHVLLGLDMQTPDRLRIVPDGRAPLDTLARQGRSGYTVVEVGAGTYALDVTAKGPAGSSYHIAVSLAGATSGFQVTPQDRAIVRSLEGQRRGMSGYQAAADLNHDGRIGLLDQKLARLNVGTATSIRPLAVTIALDSSVATTATGAVVAPSVVVTGQTAPRSLVRLGQQTTTADFSGHYQFTAPLAVGANPLRVTARDGFGQQASAALTVTRIVDTMPPTITIQSPAAGSTANDNISVSGRVTDDLTGVASLQEQVDSGPFQVVPVDAAGNFRFATTLPLDGTADGPHTAVIRATDSADNAATTSTTFTLATTLVNRSVTTDPGVQQMPSVAVDPLDPNHLVIAYMDRSLVTTGYAGIGVAVSYDAGTTWRHTSVPLPAGFDQGAANPIAKFDAEGRVYVSFMADTFLGQLPSLTNGSFSERGQADIESNNGIFVSRSDDGGNTWAKPVTVINHQYEGQAVTFEGTPDLAIDTFRDLPDGSPNPRYGTLYVTWTRIYAPGQFPGQPDASGGTDLMVSVSKDGGATWQLQLQTLPGSGLTVSAIQDPVNESGEGIPLGLGLLDQVRITVGPEGDIYISNAGGGDDIVQHSTDGGQSFSTVDHDTGVGIPFGTGYKSFPDSTLPTNQFRTNLARAIAADPTRPGTVYAAEAIQVADPLGNIVDSADIRFSVSTDHGLTWTSSVMTGPFSGPDLNDDNDGQSATGSRDDVVSGQAMPRIAVGPQGDVAVIWYDTRRDPQHHLLDVFGSLSSDGGRTFSPNFRLTDQSFDADAGKFTDPLGNTNDYLGDFIGLALTARTIYAAWTDTRNGNQDVVLTHEPISPAPSPPSDRLEPNNSPQAATDLGMLTSAVVPKLTLPAGDDDWFRFQAGATGNLTVTVLPDDPRFNPTLELRDSSGAILGQGSGQLVVAGDSGKSYLVHVLSGAMALAAASPVSSGYTLEVTSLTADLGSVSHLVQTGTLHSGDQVYYHLFASASGSLDLTLTPGNPGARDVNLVVLDPDKLTVLATAAPGAGGTPTASLAVQQGQSLLVGISGATAPAEDYRLELTNLDQFATPSSASLLFPAGAGPSTVAVGDLNGDGKDDMVVADGLSDTLAVLLGNGDGTFQAPREFTIGAFRSPSPVETAVELPNFRRQVVIADFNRDHIPDVAVTNYDSGDVSVLLGRGDGTFDPQRRFDATSAPWGLATGDFNGDGIPDLAAIDSHGQVDSTVAILLGRGDGTFQPERTFAALTGASYPFSTVAVADLDHDGKDDLVVSGSNDQRASVFLSNGDGTFRHAGDARAARLAAGAVLLDLDGNGALDLVTTAFDANAVFVNLGNTDGSFAPPVSFAAGQQPVALTVADLGSQLNLPDGSTTFGPPDGHADLIVADGGNYTGGGAVSGLTGVYVLPMLVDDQGHYAGFGNPHLLAAGLAPQSLAVGGFTGTSTTDVAFVDRDGIHVIYQNPPAIPANDTPQTARDLGTILHIVEPAQTIVPGHEDAYYSLTVPTETARGAGNEVIDFSAGFDALAGAGLMMEVRDAAGNLLGSGERFRVSAAQGATLTLHVLGATAPDGTRGAGAYTLDIDVLPQVVSVEAQALLPGQGNLPGGATASLVVTLQGDRLDPATAENPASYTVTCLGPDGKLGTADDQVIPLAMSFQSVVYDPSANLDVSSGKIHPTALRQTVTLLFSQPLPAGSYQVTLSSAIQAAPFTADEASLLSGGPAFAGHPVAGVASSQVTNGSVVTATDLVLASGALGNLNTLKSGNAFLTQLHDDLSALFDAQKTAQGGQAQITPALIDQVLNRLEQGLGAPGKRTTTAVALVFDPVSIGVEDPSGGAVGYDLGTGDLTDTTKDSYVDVDGNIEVVILFDPPAFGGDITVNIGDVPPDASGAAVVLGTADDTTMDLTDEIDAGMTQFDIPPD
jgi:hypothetical protein